jgi:hypothetical protein
MFTCEPPHTCHRCNATRKDFLSTAVFPSKSTAARRRAVEQAAAGQGRNIRGMQADKVARFLFEFHAADYQALALPAIPSSASSGAIHKLLKTEKVCRCMLLLPVNSNIV